MKYFKFLKKFKKLKFQRKIDHLAKNFDLKFPPPESQQWWKNFNKNSKMRTCLVLFLWKFHHKNKLNQPNNIFVCYNRVSYMTELVITECQFDCILVFENRTWVDLSRINKFGWAWSKPSRMYLCSQMHPKHLPQPVHRSHQAQHFSALTGSTTYYRTNDYRTNSYRM